MGIITWSIALAAVGVRFYPRQTMKEFKQVKLKTPDKYLDDCLHPCVRRIDGTLYMTLSPYPNQDAHLENPLLYRCSNEQNQTWEFINEVASTPSTGYNSDPALFAEDGRIYVFWRECHTELCRAEGVDKATVGSYSIDNGKTFSSPTLFLSESSKDSDAELCPVLIKRNGKYLFYASDYQFAPKRKNIGLAVWEGNLSSPFELTKRLAFKNILVCDSLYSTKLFGRMIHIPKVLKHDLWHFDLYEYLDKLYMISVSEYGQNILLSVSTDGEKFKTYTTPLVNIHAWESEIEKKVLLYKPSFYIENDEIHLYFTTTENFKSNELYYAKIDLNSYK